MHTVSAENWPSASTCQSAAASPLQAVGQSCDSPSPMPHAQPETHHDVVERESLCLMHRHSPREFDGDLKALGAPQPVRFHLKNNWRHKLLLPAQKADLGDHAAARAPPAPEKPLRVSVAVGHVCTPMQLHCDIVADRHCVGGGESRGWNVGQIIPTRMHPSAAEDASKDQVQDAALLTQHGVSGYH